MRGGWESGRRHRARASSSCSHAATGLSGSTWNHEHPFGGEPVGSVVSQGEERTATRSVDSVNDSGPPSDALHAGSSHQQRPSCARPRRRPAQPRDKSAIDAVMLSPRVDGLNRSRLLRRRDFWILVPENRRSRSEDGTTGPRFDEWFSICSRMAAAWRVSRTTPTSAHQSLRARLGSSVEDPLPRAVMHYPPFGVCSYRRDASHEIPGQCGGRCTVFYLDQDLVAQSHRDVGSTRRRHEPRTLAEEGPGPVVA